VAKRFQHLNARAAEEAALWAGAYIKTAALNAGAKMPAPQTLERETRG
jgi:hypothetical protein